MRECNENELTRKKWIVFDGPVDAIWIENMNTVLDDNKKLCLTSGEIIKLSPQISILFEVQDLAFASPATVSRCGMVYFESKQLGWLTLIKSFINTLPESINVFNDFIVRRLRTVIDLCLAWAQKYAKFAVYECDMTYVNTLIKYFGTIIHSVDVRIQHEFEDMIS